MNKKAEIENKRFKGMMNILARKQYFWCGLLLLLLAVPPPPPPPPLPSHPRLHFSSGHTRVPPCIHACSSICEPARCCSLASLPPGVAFIQRRVIDTAVDDTLLGKWLRDTVRWIFAGEGNGDKSSGAMQQRSHCTVNDKPLLTPRQTRRCWLVWFKSDKLISQ